MSEQTDIPPRPGGQPSRLHHFLRRQLPFVVLVAGLGYLVVRLLQAQPVSVEVVYRYGSARAGLAETSIRYLKGNEELRRIRYNYGAAEGAPAEQAHAIMVPPGDYDVAIELRYRGTAPSDLKHGSVAVEGGEQVKVTRPLIVTGEGRVMIHVGKDG